MTIHNSTNNLAPVLQEQHTIVQDYIRMTSRLLADLIEAEGYDCQSIFNSQDVPQISVERYLHRLHKYTHFSPQCLVLAVVYLDRYNMAEAEFSLNKFNVHRFFLTCLVLAVKFHDDIYFDNLTFEKAGGVTISQLMTFELEVFEKINFNAQVDCEEYEALH